MRALLPAQLMLGTYRASWIWRTNVEDTGVVVRGAIPAAVLVDHGDHTMQVAWARYDGGPSSEFDTFTLQSLIPLTVDETVVCEVCGLRGRIVQSAWLPDEGGPADGE